MVLVGILSDPARSCEQLLDVLAMFGSIFVLFLPPCFDTTDSATKASRAAA
jgi:hypothetical protein